MCVLPYTSIHICIVVFSSLQDPCQQDEITSVSGVKNTGLFGTYCSRTSLMQNFSFDLEENRNCSHNVGESKWVKSVHHQGGVKLFLFLVTLVKDQACSLCSLILNCVFLITLQSHGILWFYLCPEIIYITL